MALRGEVMTRRLARLLAIASLFSLLVPRLNAQQKKPEYLVETQTKMVRVYAVVFDREGRLASDLTKEDFQVLDDGVPQRIAKFSSNLREPVSIVIDADVSQSMKPKLSFVREAVDGMLEPFPNADEQAQFADEFSLIRFATRAERLTPFRRPESLQPQVSGLLQPTEGSTALFDSVYLAVDQINRNASNRRQAIILVTDGGDNHSRYSLRETRRFLEEADVPIFAVMASPGMQFLDIFVDPPSPQSSSKSRIGIPSGLSPKEGDFTGPAERRGPHNLKELTEDTGGEIFTVRRLDALPEVVRSVAIALRYSYLIGYEVPETTGALHPKGWNGRHKVSVRLVPPEKYAGYIVDAKRGYYEGFR
jgi:Ca-activated chloride channel family protein